MGRKSLISIAVLAVITTSRPIPTTAQQRGEQPNAAPSSPTPAPGRGSQGVPQQPATQNQSPGGNNAGGNQTVIVTLPQADPQPEQRRPRSDAQPEGPNWPDWIVAVFTAVLAALAGFQWWTIRQQERHMRHALAETTKAADAAKTSADSAERTLLIAHRPRLVVRPITVDGFTPTGRISASAMKLTNGKARITNVGVLDATFLKFKAQWLFGDGLPLNNPIFHAPDNSTVPALVPPGHFAEYKLDDFDVTPDLLRTIDENADRIRDGFSPIHPERLYLVGYIKYSDKIGLRRTFFGFEYHPHTRSFESVIQSQYNYEE